MSKKSFEQLLSENNIKPDFAQDKIIPKLDEFLQKTNEYIIAKQRNFISFFAKLNCLSGIYLYGNVGTGKTAYLKILYNNIKTSKKILYHSHQFILEIQKIINKIQNKKRLNDNLDLIKLTAKYFAKNYLVIYVDDLEIIDISDAMLFGRIVKELLLLNTIILITSNSAPDNLYYQGTQREIFIPYINIIKENLHITNIVSNSDYRKKNLEIMDTRFYLYKEVIDSQNFILNSFSIATNKQVPKNKILDINGREFICPITAGDCAIFTFDQLCRSPMGSDDYIAIAKEFNLIILAEIPSLSSDEFNEARRLIKLIDIIYEFKKILICSSKVEIDKIYQAGRWHNEFARTTSRLHEMQTQQYSSRNHLI